MKHDPNQEDLFGIYTQDTSTENKIETLYQKAAACRRCNNWKTREDNLKIIPMYDGTWDNPDLFLISEGPGYYEIRSGKPFQGPSGELLDRILGRIGTSRNRCFLTNVTLCRPLGDERSFPISVLNACREHWIEMVKMVSPKMIVPLGLVAMKSMFPSQTRESTMQELDGTDWSFLGIPVIPTYHPAYFLKGTPDIRQKKINTHMETWKKIKTYLESASNESNAT